MPEQNKQNNGNAPDQECTHNCDTCGADCPSKGGAAPDLHAKLNAASSVKRTIGVVSGKGGVGKSLVTGMLAVLLRRRGLRTAILDADITGPSIPAMFGVHEKLYGCEDGIVPAASTTGIEMISINLALETENTPVLWRGPVISGTVKQFYSEVVWRDVDCMLVDMPPGTGDVPLTVFQSLPLDGIVIVATPQELVGMVVSKAVEMAKMMNIPILGIVQNMFVCDLPRLRQKDPRLRRRRRADGRRALRSSAACAGAA